MTGRMPYLDLIGIKYVKFGRDKKIGLDCAGLVVEVYRRNNFVIRCNEVCDVSKREVSDPLYEQAPVGIETPRESLERGRFSTSFVKVHDDKCAPLDIVVLPNMHIGVLIDFHTVLHTSINAGSQITKLNVLQRAGMVKGIYRHVALA